MVAFRQVGLDAVVETEIDLSFDVVGDGEYDVLAVYG
jgi:hypothetical protein